MNVGRLVGREKTCAETNCEGVHRKDEQLQEEEVVGGREEKGRVWGRRE